MSARKAGLQSVAAGLCCLLVLSACPMAGAQEAAPAPKLVISILDGEGALNDIRQRTAREPIVEVQDENHKPVAGAAVLFSLPSSGPGGAFANGAQTFSTLTDATGRAMATGLRPNGVQGSYDIHVTVNYQGATAETTIHQKNVSGQSSSTTTTEQVAHGISMKAVLIIVGTAAAAGTVGAILATRGGGNSTTITPGTPTVGAPTVVGGSLTIPLHGRHR
jgi:hypothetical protein